MADPGFWQLWNTWVSLKVLGSAMKNLGQPQDTWDQFQDTCDTCVSLEILGYLG
jgi:hypothetical protein